MENPFQYLIDEHRLHLKRAHLNQSESQLEQSRIKSDRQERILEKRGFDDLVEDVLNLLQQAIYPGLSLRSDHQTWSIGRWSKRSDGSMYWDSVLVVQLVYDELSGAALCFGCLRYHREVRAELSRESLLEALQRLYPVQKDKRPPSDRPDRGTA